MNTAFLLSGLAVGFLGSFHCVGMCGPIALALPKGQDEKRSIITGRLLYNFGRIITYSFLGVLAGLAGLPISIKGFQNELSVFSGIFIVCIVIISGVSRFSLKFSGIMNGATQGLKQQFKKYFKKSSPFYLFVIGLLNGLLPCGFVYLALAAALSTGSVTGGMSYMFLFGLGTFPAMFAISMTGHLIGVKGRSFVRKASPFIAIAIAVLLIQRGSNSKRDCCSKEHKICTSKY